MDRFRRGAGVVAVALLLAACGGGGGENASPSSGGGGGATKGGVVRTAQEDFGFTNSFDPTGEYLGSAWGVYSQLLIRTLVTYNFVPGQAGNEIVPDVAEDWETSSDGLTWTFHLKSGVQFGPPLNRDVTSEDFAFAMQRINTKSLIAQYGNYYAGVIKGLTGEAKSQDDPISGIETPDESTIVFHLERPTGDLLNRLAMPATAAMPKEVAGCFDKAGDYGRYIVSTGPYMFDGADEMDASSCDALKPVSGYDPDKFMVLTRNPAYDPSTDSTDSREANPDGFVFTIDTNTDDIFNKVQSGDLDTTFISNPTGAVLSQYLTNPDLKDNIHSDPADTTYYITMNMLVPPFDDIHVRKAVNFVIDKAALLKSWGGSFRGEIATTVEPSTVNPALEGYNPYPSPDGGGDVDAAMEEIKQSKYDSDQDGKCDPDVCGDLLMISRNYTPWTDMDPIVQQNLAEIGINVKVRELDPSTAYTTIQTVDNLIPIAINARWGKDYPDPYGFDYFIFTSGGVACQGQSNYAEMGMTEDQAKECGPKVLAAWNAVTNNGRDPLPSVDDQMEKCYVLSGDSRFQCFADLDKFVMEEAVPWVPYIIGNQITVTGDSLTQYEFDQFSGYVSFAHLAVNNGLKVEDVPVG